MTSRQTLSEQNRRMLARWAAACAARVLPLIPPDDDARPAIEDALARAVAFSRGESTAAEEIGKRMVAVSAAGKVETTAGAAAARAVAQAAAVAHMGAHAFGAAAYAAKAVQLANPKRPELVEAEIAWQLGHLTDDERAALRTLPAVGEDTSGPLGPGLLATGALGATVRALQAEIGCASD